MSQEVCARLGQGTGDIPGSAGRKASQKDKGGAQQPRDRFAQKQCKL